MTPEEQLVLWLHGKSVHNPTTNKCCPDLSCCGGSMVTIDVRKKFAKAHHEGDEVTKGQMLKMFLDGA